jgi:translation elongation factor P/translation initiation factor 5A
MPNPHVRKAIKQVLKDLKRVRKAAKQVRNAVKSVRKDLKHVRSGVKQMLEENTQARIRNPQVNRIDMQVLDATSDEATLDRK